MLCRIASVLAFCFLLATQAAAQTCPPQYNRAVSTSPWYWSVQNASPGTQVWDKNAGAYVPLADAGYVAFLAAGCTADSIDTNTNLWALIAGYALGNHLGGSGWGLTTYSLTGDLHLTNPLPTGIVVTTNASGYLIYMPQANLPTSAPIGQPFEVTNNNTSFTFGVVQFGYTSGPVPLVYPGETLTWVNSSFATTSGTPAAVNFKVGNSYAWRTQRGGSGSTTGNMILLGGSAGAVNLNSATTDTAITITSPTPNYRIQSIVVKNTGATASLTTATAGLFTSTGGGGLALAADQALSAITANAVGTDANLLALTQTVANRTAISSATLQFRVGTPQGAAATADVYVYIQPLP